MKNVSINWKTLSYLFALFLIFTGVDYKNLGDIWRFGKIRYLLIFLPLIGFFHLKKYITWPLAYLAAYATISFTIYDYQVYSTFPLILLYATLYAGFLFSSLGENTFGKYVAYFGALQAVIAIPQAFGHHFLFTPNEAWGKYLASGLMGHNTVLGPLMVGCLAPALWQRRYVAAALLFTAAILCKSSMTYASLAVVLWAWYWHRMGNFWAFTSAYIGVIAFGVFYLVAPNHELFGTSGRMPIWEHALNAWKSGWLFGNGWGFWQFVYAPEMVGLVGGVMRWDEIHNELLEGLVAWGLILVCPILYGILQFLRTFKPTWPHAVCAALLVNSTGNFTFQIAPLALLFIVSWIFCARGTDAPGEIS